MTSNDISEINNPLSVVLDNCVARRGRSHAALPHRAEIRAVLTADNSNVRFDDESADKTKNDTGPERK